MKLNVLTEFDVLFEVSTLTITAMDFEKAKSKLINDLNDLGLKGDTYYTKNLKIFDKYIKTFKKNMVLDNKNTFDFLFKDEDNYSSFIFLNVLLGNRKIYENIDLFTNDDLRLEFLNAYNDMYETDFSSSTVKSLENILLFLDSSNFNETTKWWFMLVLDNPKKYYSQFISLINKNINAFYKAVESIKKDLPKLINNYVKYINNDKHGLFKSLISNLDDSFTIIPSMSMSIVALIPSPNNLSYVGLLFEDLYDSQMNSMGLRGDLVYKLKSLSDKSKMDILLLLKSGAKYSLEIAEALKLTPATVSYHMSHLLECGMVSLTKEYGKAYYQLSKENIKLFINDLENTLLS